MRKHSKRAVKAIKAPAISYYLPYLNTLNDLIPDLYAGMDVVSRELVGYIPSVTRNASAERAAVGQAVRWHVAPAGTAVNITPAMTVPTAADVAIGSDTMTITKAKAVPFGWTGEEQRGLDNGGAGYLSVQADLFAQALRTLVNEVEADLATEAALKASRAYGAVGTIPFATNLAEAAQVRKILDDNGAPASERSMIINTVIGASMRTLGQLTKVNEAGTTMTVRDGELLNLMGLSVKESAQSKRHTAGDAASGTTGAAGYAIGATSIATAATGTGALLPGDVITFNGDTNKYVVVTGKAAMGTGTTSIVIAAPGLRQAIPASATNITVVATGDRSTAFARSALHLAARAPALPKEGDSAADRMMITDPRSGLTFEVAIYLGYRMVRLEVSLAWGVKASKTEHIAVLLGG